jgi:hypothetical protein
MKRHLVALAALLLSALTFVCPAWAGAIIPPQAGCGIAVSGATISAEGQTTNGDSNFSIPASASWVATSATLTAPRTWTLPAASALLTGCTVVISDAAGGVTAANTLTIARAGSDTISGATGVLLQAAYTSLTLRSNGSNAWTIVGDELTVATSCPSGQFAVASNASGNLLTCAAPSFGNLSGSVACSQTPGYTGGVTKAAGSCATVNPAYVMPAWQSFSVNSAYMPGAFNLSNLGTGAIPTTDTQFYSQVVSPGSYVITGLGVYVTTGQTGGAARLCVYADAAGVPGALLADFGTVVLTASSTMEVATGTTLAVTPGEPIWIDVAIKGVATAPTLVGYAPGVLQFPMTATEIKNTESMRGLYAQLASSYPTSGCTSTPPTLVENPTGGSGTPAPFIKVQ